MKKVKLTGKLSLNKKMISSLNEEQMFKANGGGTLGKADGIADDVVQVGFLSIGKHCSRRYECSCKITVALFCGV